MEFRLNLASRSYLDRRTARRWFMLVGNFAGVLLALNLYYGYSNWQQLNQVNTLLAELDAKLLSQRSEVTVAYTPENLARVKAQVGSARQLVAADRFRWTDLLGRLEKLLPDDVALRTLKPNYRDRSLQVTGVAQDTEAMTELLDRMLSSSDLHDVYLLNQSQTVQQNGDLVLQFALVIKGAF